MKVYKMKRFVWFLLIVPFLFGCEGADVEYKYPVKVGRGDQYGYEEPEKFFGKDGFSLFESGSSKDSGSSGGGGIGVNSFLWRASLDTIAFMPLLSADPFGGVIITDWYGPPESQGERFKLNIFILGTSLRSDGVRATVFRQTKGREGSWMDASRDEKLDRDVEDSILTRARELKINSLPQR